MRAYALLPYLLLSLGARAHDETYDFVIAGAGTAGLVVANRLSADPSITVAVVDPGDYARDYPGVLTVENIGNTFNASIDWAYTSIPQPNIGNRSIQYHAGKAIGGTSTINGMVYIRGNKAQFDAWESLGNDGWNWDTIFEYSKRAENFTIPDSSQLSVGVTYDAEAHGESGPLKTGYIYNLENSTFHDAVQQSFEAQGLPFNQDLDGGETRGFSSYPQTVDRDANVREDAARAYYYPIEDRPNLKIINGTVKRVTWAEGGGEGGLLADGLEFSDPAGDVLTIKATKDVILSAGSWRTPIILEGSGVGNPSILAQHGVETKIDLPTVGASVQDQWVNTMVYSTSTNVTGHVPYVIFPTAQDVFGSDTASIAASVKANLSSWAQAASDASNGSVSAAAIEKRFEIQHDLIFNQNVTIAEIYTIGSPGVAGSSYWILMPFSWGSVHSDSSADIVKPVIDANVFSVDFDIQMIVGIGKLVRNAWASPPLSDMVVGNVVPGDSVLPANATDAQWAAFAKGGAVSSYHIIGSCAMMSQDLGGVVDSTLRVYGTQNVRVVDASIIPIQMDGHPTATLYGVAERAAVLIQDAWA